MNAFSYDDPITKAEFIKSSQMLHVAPQIYEPLCDLHVITDIEKVRNRSHELVGHLGGSWGLYSDETI